MVTVSKVRMIKERADSLLEEVFRSMFEEIDTERLRRDVEALRAGMPDFEPSQLAQTLVRRTAIRCAAAGALSGLPGGVLAIATLGADLAYLVFQQFRLILGIATLYGHEPSQRERFAEALSCIAYASGVGIGKQGIMAALGSATVEGSAVAERIGSRFAQERLSKFIPFVGMLSGSALNWISVSAAGRAAIRYYDAQVAPQLAAAILADGDREHA
jgi:hypothetical protein